MKSLIIFTLFSLMCFGCEKNNFNPGNPDVEKFVKMLKNGTYNFYEWTDDGERLWARMPAFQKKDIPALISLAKDTVLVTPCDHFPVNPISSMWPFRIVDGKECILLGEYLLWCAEAVIEGKDFASLNPMLGNVNNTPDQRLDAFEILAVRNIYQHWFDEYGHQDAVAKLPLEGTVYIWR